MQERLNKSKFEKSIPVPDQQEIDNILHLTEKITAKDEGMGFVKKVIGFRLPPSFGDGINAISVERLTKEGEKLNPTSHLALVRIYKKRGEISTQANYQISRESNNRLKIVRFSVSSKNKTKEYPVGKRESQKVRKYLSDLSAHYSHHL